MDDQIKKFLYKKIEDIKGLSAIIISDREGVPVIKVTTKEAPEFALRSSHLSSFNIASDLCQKLEFGNCEYLICSYTSHTVIHFNRHPLTVSFVATESSNIGSIISLESKLSPVLEPLASIVIEQDK